MLASQSAVYVVTTLSVDAYEANTGELKWSTKLGEGHVYIISQLDNAILRVYYGGRLFELDSDTGTILSVTPKENTIWVSSNIILKASSSNQLSAFNKQTGRLIWDSGRLFLIDEDLVPQYVEKDTLIVGNRTSWSFIGEICALNMQTGIYNWCRPETFNSMMAVDHQSKLGFALRNDSVLLTIDLQSGDVLGETSFLSSEPNEGQPDFASITVSKGVLVVSFGDSMQTFGL